MNSGQSLEHFRSYKITISCSLNCKHALLFFLRNVYTPWARAVFTFSKLAQNVCVYLLAVHYQYITICIYAHGISCAQLHCRPFCLWNSICVYVCFAEYEWMHMDVFSFAVGFQSGLQLLKSMRFNTSSNLTLWHRFEAMRVRLERHRSSFLSTESWSYVIALRPVKFPLKRHAPEGEDKAATWSVSLISLFL